MKNSLKHINEIVLTQGTLTKEGISSLPTDSGNLIFWDLFDNFAPLSIDRQRDFADLTEGIPWSFNLEKGTIMFEDYTFPMQVYGSFSKSSGTWLWAWENQHLQQTPKIIANSLLLKQLGERFDISHLTVPQYDSNQNELYDLGLIACGMFGQDGFFLADYGQGIMLLTVTFSEEIKEEFEEIGIEREVTVIGEFLEQYEVSNQVDALEAYLYLKGFKVTIANQEILAEAEGKFMKIGFNEDNFLTSLNTEL
ncbi:DUF6882 domain-containing protein [Flectobacillus roseus]